MLRWGRLHSKEIESQGAEIAEIRERLPGGEILQVCPRGAPGDLRSSEWLWWSWHLAVACILER